MRPDRRSELPAARSIVVPPQLDDPSLSAVDAVVSAFNANLSTGLTQSEALHRLTRDGPNALDAKPGTALWRRVLGHFRDPLVYLLPAYRPLGSWRRSRPIR